MNIKGNLALLGSYLTAISKTVLFRMFWIWHKQMIRWILIPTIGVICDTEKTEDQKFRFEIQILWLKLTIGIGFLLFNNENKEQEL